MQPVYQTDLTYSQRMALYFLGLHLGNCIGLYKNEDNKLFAQFASCKDLYIYDCKSQQFEKY